MLPTLAPIINQILQIMLKKTLFSLIVLTATLSTYAQTVANQGPNVDQILANYFANTGGLDKWKALTTTKMVGNMSMQGMEFPGTILAKTPNKQRVEVNVQGKQIVQAYDGETAWWINPFASGDEPQKMPAEYAEEMTKQEFESPFLNYKEKGNAVELLGKKTIEGAETFEVKLTKKNGDVEYHYFDTENFVTIMVKTPVNSGPMKGQESEMYFSDYQEVNGMMFPFFMESKMAGQTMQKITISAIEINGKYEDTLFAFPKK